MARSHTSESRGRSRTGPGPCPADAARRRSAVLPVVSLVLVVATASSVRAESWPGWRGPRGDGTSQERDVPLRWGPEEGVCWRVDVPGEGHASPIVTGGRVFVVSCDTDSLERLLVCYDAETGALRWRRTVLTAPLEIKHGLNSYASSTPATDGERVFVAFWETAGELVPARNVSAERDA